MKKSLPTRQLPEQPNLEQLRRQAKELLKGFRAGRAEDVAQVSGYFPDASPEDFALHEARLVLARSYGFDSWPKLKAYVDGITLQRLAAAVRSDHGDRVEAMLKARPELVNLDMAENDEHRVLHYAVYNRSARMVRLLMLHGADARKGIYPHRAATSALTIATERGYDEIVTIIQEEEGRRRRASSGPEIALTPAPDQLTELIVNGKDDESLALLEGNPDLAHAANRNGWTPLHIASATRNARLVKWLLEHGADANRTGPNNHRPLDNAVGQPGWSFGGAEDFLRVSGLLRQHGAEMSSRAAVALGDAEWIRNRHEGGSLENPIEDWGGLLTIAVIHDRPQILEMLLDFGFDPNERVRLKGLEETVWTAGMPLWHAAASGKLDMAELLLSRGADPNVEVYASGSAVYSAYRQSDWKMVELLRRHGGAVDPVTAGIFRETKLGIRMLEENPAIAPDLLRGSTDGGDPELVRRALQKIHWAPGDDRWYWILMQPIRGTHLGKLDPQVYPECFRMVLERCDPNLRHPRFGRTILHDVAAFGKDSLREESVAFATLLLDAGARLSERDDILKSTPLGWACRWGNGEIAKLLLQRGADPIERDAEPWAAPRAWARRMGHHAILDLLDQRGG